MYTSISNSLFWLQLLLVYLFIQVPACMAQDGTSSIEVAATANARGPDSSKSVSIQPSSTSSAPAQTHTIKVGLADHKFQPDVTQAAAGDTIEFRFYPANHSVVRAEYGLPCIPYEMTGQNKAGFFSGFHAVDKVLDDTPSYSILINDTDPIFFYCSAVGSCLNYAMVGAINPNATTPISTQQHRARDSAYMLNPGESFPPESPLPSGIPADKPFDKKHGLAPGAIAGIVVGALSFILIAAIMLYLWGRTKALSEEVERKASTVTRRLSPSNTSGMVQHSNTSPPSSSTQRQNANSGFGVYQSRYTTASRDVDADHKPSTPQLLNHPAFASPYEQQQAQTQDPALFELGNAGYAANGYLPIQHIDTPFHQRTVPTPLPGNEYAQRRTASPPIPGYAYAQQRMDAYGQQSTVSPPNAAPPYGWHVNPGREPAEIEGTMVRGEERKAGTNVKKEEGEGRTKEREVRWEEVGGKEGVGRAE